VSRGFGRDGLDERVVRGIVFARLADFIGGHAKVRPELARRVAALLDGPMPRVPLAGLLNGIRSVFPPVQTEREGQGTQAGELTAIFSRAALTGQLDFPGQRPGP